MKKFYSTLIKLNVGDRVVVPKSNARMVQHHAIFLGFQNGYYWFIENKDGIGVRVVTAETFFIGVNEITKIEPFIPKSDYNRTDLFNYALSKKGKAYNLISYNCEHFANEVQHRVIKSKQADTGVGLALFALAVLLIGGASGGKRK